MRSRYGRDQPEECSPRTTPGIALPGLPQQQPAKSKIWQTDSGSAGPSTGRLERPTRRLVRRLRPREPPRLRRRRSLPARPTLTPTPGPIHRDLGNFIFELRRQLAGRGFTPSPPIPGNFERLCDSFLQGYSDARGSTLDDTDLALIALFELRRAAGMARKRFPRRPGDALWFARSAMASRREVVASPDHP